MSKIKAALPYYGGKQKRKLNEWIRSHLPENYDQTYIEPFAGMASVLLNRRKVGMEILNDLDENIISFWRELRDNSDEFLDKIKFTPHSRSELESSISTIYFNPKYPTQSERALATYIILAQGIGKRINNSYSFSGCRRNAYYNRCVNYSNRLITILDRIKDVILERKDALDIIQFYTPIKESVMYIDPPYQRLGRYKYDIKDLDKFKKVLIECKGYVAISGYPGDYDDLGWDRYEFKTNASQASNMKIGSRKRTECIWTNR